MSNIICFSPAKEQFDVNGRNLGMGHDRALCYSKKLGRKRIYRSGYPTPDKRLTVLTFKSDSEAKAVCDEINKVYNDDFKPLDIKF
jgi:hypothetical protein